MEDSIFAKLHMNISSKTITLYGKQELGLVIHTAPGSQSETEGRRGGEPRLPVVGFSNVRIRITEAT